MRLVLAGLGSIGRRHLGNLRTLAPDAEIVVFRHTRSDEAPPEEADRVVYSIEDAIAARPQAAFVCGPTSTHVDIGRKLLRAGAHLFVEKPLAVDVAGARELVEAAAAARLLLAVGYNLRFLTSLRALRASLLAGEIGRPMTLRAEVGQYLPEWRPGTDYRKGNSARASLGGDVTLELSHEIDYVRWLLGEPVCVSAMSARLSDLDIEIDDTAELLLRFHETLASIHLDMAQRSTTRTCRVVGTHGTLMWDGNSGELHVYKENGWTTKPVADQDRNGMYVEEVAHFLACVRGEAEPLVTGVDGLRTVEIAAAARRSSREARSVEL